MTPRRFFAGTLVLSGLTGWCWCSHDDSDPARPPTASLHTQMTSSAPSANDADGNRAEQEYRFRTSQCRHWRHLMLGTR